MKHSQMLAQRRKRKRIAKEQARAAKLEKKLKKQGASPAGAAAAKPARP